MIIQNFLQTIHISLFNIILLLFAFFAWTRVFLRFRSGDTSIKWFVFWSIIWFGLVLIIFLPGKADFFTRVLGVSRAPDAMLTLAVVLLLYTVYRLYVKIDSLEGEITGLTRHITLSAIKARLKKNLG